MCRIFGTVFGSVIRVREGSGGLRNVRSVTSFAVRRPEIRVWNNNSYFEMNSIAPSSPPSLRPSGDDKALIIICHLSSLLGVGIILPLIVYLIKKDEPGRTAAHAGEVLNFHLSLLVYALCAIPLVFIFVGIFIYIAIAVGSLVFAIIAAIKASEGVLYRYPFCIRFIS
jgi:uncharacterized Tic20 family protein